jgi:beta-glucosidase/6-phospho-beta-glucosidase/beta-galactosidase
MRALDEVALPFWIGGYKGADHVNAAGDALDMARDSGHLARLEEDHRRAAQVGLRAVRESIGWRLCEHADGTIDLERVLRIAHSARRHGLTVLWTLMHYGVPDGASLRDDALIARFERFAREVARTLRQAKGPNGALVYTPVNEISYLAWAASQRDQLQPPNGAHDAGGEDTLVSGYTIKRRLARAALAAVHAMRDVDAQARFMHVEPIVHVVAPADAPELADEARRVAAWQWQSWDLLCGRLESELGGSPDAIDLMGFNHYHSSQWELRSERRLAWHLQDPRRRPLGQLLFDAWQRYRKPQLLAEAGHVGSGRAAWLHDVAAQVQNARARGVPVRGLCLYPLVDRPDWNVPRRWHRSGLWHVECDGVRAGKRIVEPELRTALAHWQRVLPSAAAPSGPTLVAFGRAAWDNADCSEAPLLQALAPRWRIVFVEPARDDATQARLDALAQGPQLTRLVPRLPPALSASARAAAHHTLLQAWLAERVRGSALAWTRDDTATRRAAALGLHAAPPPTRWPALDLTAHARARNACYGWAADEARSWLADGTPWFATLWRGGSPPDRAWRQALQPLGTRVRIAVFGGEPSLEAPLHPFAMPPRGLLPALLCRCVGWLQLHTDDGDMPGMADALAAGLPVVAVAAPSWPAAAGAVCVVRSALELRRAVWRLLDGGTLQSPATARTLRLSDARKIAAQWHEHLTLALAGADLAAAA